MDNAASVSRYTSITIGADGLPIISYYDETNFDLKVVYCGDPACTTGNVVTTVDSAGVVGEYTSITLGFDGLPVISYFDGSANDLKDLHCGTLSP